MAFRSDADAYRDNYGLESSFHMHELKKPYSVAVAVSVIVALVVVLGG